MSGVLAIVHFALHTYSRAYPGAPKPAQLGSGSRRTTQAAGVSQLDDQPPSGPRARAFPGLGAHRGMGRSGRRELLRAATLLPHAAALQPHKEQLPAQRPMVSCHARTAACGLRKASERCGQAPASSMGRAGGAASTSMMVPKEIRRIGRYSELKVG